jgi:hypothetical protein
MTTERGRAAWLDVATEGDEQEDGWGYRHRLL